LYFKNCCKDTDIFLKSLSDERKKCQAHLEKDDPACFWGSFPALGGTKRWNHLEWGRLARVGNFLGSPRFSILPGVTYTYI
jgi:hypothetical protein